MFGDASAERLFADLVAAVARHVITWQKKCEPQQPYDFSCFVLLGGMMISLAGKAALITGGSRGIGAAAVKLFAQAGADVVFNYNKAKDAAEQVQQEAGKHGTRVEAFKADVGHHADTRNWWICDRALGAPGYPGGQRRVWNPEDLPIEKMSEKHGTR